jgi:hypothetical protein
VLIFPFNLLHLRGPLATAAASARRRVLLQDPTEPIKLHGVDEETEVNGTQEPLFEVSDLARADRVVRADLEHEGPLPGKSVIRVAELGPQEERDLLHPCRNLPQVLNRFMRSRTARKAGILIEPTTVHRIVAGRSLAI